jgi:O-antigen/teichoic acid export membrane protein
LTASFVPYLYEGLDDKKQYDEIRKVTYGIVGIFGIILVIVTAFAPDIVSIFTTSEYKDGITLIPPIAAGIFMISISGIYSCLLIYLHKSKYMIVGVSVAAAINVILNYFGIMHYGYKVAAYTTLFSYIIMTLIQHHIVKKEYIKSTNDVFIFDKKVFCTIAILVLIGCLVNLLFYGLGYFRYIYILIVCLIIFINRKKIEKLIRIIFNKREY